MTCGRQLERIITSGQTGADQAGWRAAAAAGIATGGAMPAGFMTEQGPRPEFQAMYGAEAVASSDCSAWTLQNINEVDATLWFGPEDAQGGCPTLSTCRLMRRPYLVVAPEGQAVRSSGVAAWLREHNVTVLYVTGNSESTSPGIGARVEAFLSRVFRLLARDQIGER